MVTEVTTDNFKDEVLDADGKVLVDFWAQWCNPCMMLSPLVDQVAEEESSIKVCKVNCDEARELALEYGIMSIPCLLLFENGMEINRSIGYIEKKDILEFIK